MIFDIESRSLGLFDSDHPRFYSFSTDSYIPLRDFLVEEGSELLSFQLSSDTPKHTFKEKDLVIVTRIFEFLSQDEISRLSKREFSNLVRQIRKDHFETDVESDFLPLLRVNDNTLRVTMSLDELFKSNLSISKPAWQFDVTGQNWGDEYIKGLYEALEIDTSKKPARYYHIQDLIDVAKSCKGSEGAVAGKLLLQMWGTRYGWDVLKEVTEKGRKPSEGQTYEQLLAQIGQELASEKKDLALLKAATLVERSNGTEKKKKSAKNSNPPKKSKNPKTHSVDLTKVKTEKK